MGEAQHEKISLTERWIKSLSFQSSNGGSPTKEEALNNAEFMPGPYWKRANWMQVVDATKKMAEDAGVLPQYEARIDAITKAKEAAGELV